MDDAEFVFVTDIAEKKKAGWGASHKVRGGGMNVRMPSDTLTRKERERMNGEVVSYNLSKPVVWKEFKSWPDDIQVQYVKGLQKKYGAPAKFVASMLGIHQTTLSGWSKSHNVKWTARGKDSKLPYDKWNAFLGGEIKEEVDVPETPVVANPVIEAKPVENVTLHADKTNIAAVLAMLVGTGAKLTIEVTL